MVQIISEEMRTSFTKIYLSRNESRSEHITNESKLQQDGSYHGKALNVPTAFEGLWSSSNNIKTLYEIK